MCVGCHPSVCRVYLICGVLYWYFATFLSTHYYLCVPYLYVKCVLGATRLSVVYILYVACCIGILLVFHTKKNRFYTLVHSAVDTVHDCRVFSYAIPTCAVGRGARGFIVLSQCNIHGSTMN